MLSCELCKTTYFEEVLRVNNESKLCNNNLLRENKPPALTGIRKITAGVFESFRVVVRITLRFHVTCIDQSNFESLAIEL